MTFEDSEENLMQLCDSLGLHGRDGDMACVIASQLLAATRQMTAMAKAGDIIQDESLVQKAAIAIALKSLQDSTEIIKAGNHRRDRR